MGSCLKGKSEVGKEAAKFVCVKCGAAALKEGHLCKAERVVGQKSEKGDRDWKQKK